MNKYMDSSLRGWRGQELVGPAVGGPYDGTIRANTKDHFLVVQYPKWDEETDKLVYDRQGYYDWSEEASSWIWRGWEAE